MSTAGPVLSLIPSDEERAFRETIHAMPASHGPAYCTPSLPKSYWIFPTHHSERHCAP